MPALSKQLSVAALLCLGLTWWSVSKFELIKFSTETLVKSADRLIDRSQMTQEQSQELDRTFREIVNNDRAWKRIAETQRIAVLGFTFLAGLFAYAGWAARRLQRKLSVANSTPGWP
jgi:hypothetical protein